MTCCKVKAHRSVYLVSLHISTCSNWRRGGKWTRSSPERTGRQSCCILIQPLLSSPSCLLLFMHDGSSRTDLFLWGFVWIVSPVWRVRDVNCSDKRDFRLRTYGAASIQCKFHFKKQSWKARNRRNILQAFLELFSLCCPLTMSHNIMGRCWCSPPWLNGGRWIDLSRLTSVSHSEQTGELTEVAPQWALPGQWRALSENEWELMYVDRHNGSAGGGGGDASELCSLKVRPFSLLTCHLTHFASLQLSV